MRPAEGWRRPAPVAGVGVLLLLGGYAAIAYVPLTPAEAEQERKLATVRQAAEAAEVATGAPVAGPMTEAARQQSLYQARPHPYLLPGRVAFYTGLALVLTGAALWY